MGPQTRQELIDYALRALGAPVIDINVEATQLEDRVDEALTKWFEFHSDASTRTLLKHQVTSTNITNEYITLPPDIISVLKVLPFGKMKNINIWTNQFFNDLIHNISSLSGGLSYYAQTMDYLDLMNNTFGSELVTFVYKRHGNELHLMIDWQNDILVGDYIVLEAQVMVDPLLVTEVYNDNWLKRYLVQLIKRQWGINLKKFDGMQLPGGVTFSGQQLYDEAMTEIEKLEEELRLTWETPVDFFVG